MTIDEFNEAIKKIKSECEAHNNCVECLMNKNCNNAPEEWKEVTINDVQ